MAIRCHHPPFRLPISSNCLLRLQSTTTIPFRFIIVSCRGASSHAHVIRHLKRREFLQAQLGNVVGLHTARCGDSVWIDPVSVHEAVCVLDLILHPIQNIGNRCILKPAPFREVKVLKRRCTKYLTPREAGRLANDNLLRAPPQLQIQSSCLG